MVFLNDYQIVVGIWNRYNFLKHTQLNDLSWIVKTKKFELEFISKSSFLSNNKMHLISYNDTIVINDDALQNYN